jgi:squalene-hopene/tetraprenyl-beta-curcumene cyclase
LSEATIDRRSHVDPGPSASAGGWAFQYNNDHYPDLDDTAVVAMAMHRLADRRGGKDDEGVLRGREWVEGLQSHDGGWAAFDADNDKDYLNNLPFADHGALLDPPTADVSARVISLLAQMGEPVDSPRMQAGLAWLEKEQEADGSWFGRWGVNHVYGTGAVVPALIAAGMDPAGEPVRRAVRWLEDHQNVDGGWGEDCRSYDDPAWIGRGASPASQTAWALLALHAAGEDSLAVRRGIEWLVETQRPNGTWDERAFTGTGFPSHFYINYHLYRLVFPLMALGRCTR